MRKSLAIATASLVALAGAAYAQSQPAPAAAPTQITRAEVQTKVKEHFAKLDADSNGVVTRAEFDAAREKKRQEWQAKAAERRAERFASMDTNKDSQISRAEFDAAHQPRADRQGDGKRDGKRWAHHRHHDGKAMGFGMRGGDKWFARLDPQNKGQVTLADATAKALEHFDKVDTNRDGVINAEERKAAREKMREQWKAKRSS